MAETYMQMKERHQQEVNAFPFGWAFSQKQFEEMMQRWGLNANEPADLKKIAKIGGGGFIRKADSPAMHEMFDRHNRERREAMKAPDAESGFLYEMFRHELDNHEYCVTCDPSDALAALGLTEAEVVADERMRRAYEKAREESALNWE